MTDQVAELRQEIAALRSLLPSNENSPTDIVRISVHVENVGGDRRPFLVVFRSPVELRLRLSVIRTAILITLLADLDRRSRGVPGHGVRESVHAVLKYVAPPTEDLTRAQEQIRVGLYRFASFWRQECAQLPLAFESVAERFEVPGSNGKVEVQVISPDPLIEEALTSLGRLTTLDRLRQDRFLFVPAGGGGGERFLREIYEQPDQLRVLSAYSHLTMVTVPPRLLERYRPEAVPRMSIMHRRLRDANLGYTEIIPEDSIRKLIKPQPDGSYPEYPGMSHAEVVERLQFLLSLLDSTPSYRLVLTRAEIPFYVAVYQTSLDFSITSFFRMPHARDAMSFSSFAVWGSELVQMTKSTLFEWLLNHPSTTSERHHIRAEVTNALELLKESHPAAGR